MVTIVLTPISPARRSSARKWGPFDQPPPVISTPSTPRATHLSSMSVKDRLPMTSVQMESFISWILAAELIIIDPDRAAVRRADAVLEPAHAFRSGLDARVMVGLQECLISAPLRVDRLSDPKVDVGPAVAEAFRVKRAHPVDREAFLFEIGHAVVHDLVRLPLDLVNQLIGMRVRPFDGGLRADEAVTLTAHVARID